MTEHTPGPWRFTHPDNVRGEWSCSEDTQPQSCWQPVADSEGRAIALVVDSTANWPGRGLFEADGRLIAAAPDLLEALVAMADRCGGADRRMWEAARAAIAKATGSAS